MTLELARQLYVTQVRIRAFEQRVSALFAANALPGFVHLCLGQEGVAAGACAALRPDDVITSNHRGHGHCLSKGADMNRMMAELFGRADGYCGGAGGSMHIADLERGVLGANGIVGAGIPIAAGAALAFSVRGESRVALTFFGDGAANEGSFSETLNLAMVWRLPLIFLCEHNGYAEMTPADVHTTRGDLSGRAAAYGAMFERVDGTDALAVAASVQRAAAACRAGRGPVIVQADCNRWHGHFEGDAQRYRAPEELADARSRDPIDELGARLLAEGWATSEWMADETRKADEEVESAVAHGEAAPRAELQTVLASVYRR